MSLSLIFHISDFHNLKIVNNIFLFIFEGGFSFCPGVYVFYVYSMEMYIWSKAMDDWI